MLSELNSCQKPNIDSWLVEMRNELEENAKIKEKLYNFDFNNICPRRETEEKISWKLLTNQPVRVGNIRKKVTECILNRISFPEPVLCENYTIKN